MKSLHLVVPFPLGDQVVFTGVIRELHRNHPGVFRTSVDAPVPEVWWHNPHVTLRRHSRALTLELDGDYTAGANSNRRHMAFGFAEVLSRAIGMPLPISDVCGQIFLSPDELARPSPVAEAMGCDAPYWIVCNGGKFDRTVKWWPDESYQAVVDALRERILFVQVGSHRHYHPRLEHTIDLRGWTDIRTLIRLVYHAEGVLCPITGLMHLASAVPRRPGLEGPRPCVVVGGGIEPPHWSVYPGQRFHSTVGAIECAGDGCWRSRTRLLGDGAWQDQASALCVNVSRGFPACMRMIEPDAVVASIEACLAAGACSSITPRHWKAARPVLRVLKGSALDQDSIQRPTLGLALDRYLQKDPDAESCNTGRGRGIVSMASGRDYLGSAWVSLRLLRHLGCELPMELRVDSWIPETAPDLAADFQALNCNLIPLPAEKKSAHSRRECFAAKYAAIQLSGFREVLWLDADCLPTADPTPLFDWREYQTHGLVLWPDLPSSATTSKDAWRVFQVEHRPGPEAQGGIMLVDKSRAAKALSVADWCNRNHKVFYELLYGDKDILRLACFRTQTPFHMPSATPRARSRSLEQPSGDGLPAFCHRVASKFRWSGPNYLVSWFPHENRCHEYWREFQLRARKLAIESPRAATPDTSRRASN